MNPSSESLSARVEATNPPTRFDARAWIENETMNFCMVMDSPAIDDAGKTRALCELVDNVLALRDDGLDADKTRVYYLNAPLVSLCNSESLETRLERIEAYVGLVKVRLTPEQCVTSLLGVLHTSFSSMAKANWPEAAREQVIDLIAREICADRLKPAEGFRKRHMAMMSINAEVAGVRHGLWSRVKARCEQHDRQDDLQ